MIKPVNTEAAILIAQNQPLVVDTIELPAELDVGQVLVQLKVSGICGSQLGEIAGVKGPDRYLPHLMGHEGFATVLETGPGVKHVHPGDGVVLHWRPGAGPGQLDVEKKYCFSIFIKTGLAVSPGPVLASWPPGRPF